MSSQPLQNGPSPSPHFFSEVLSLLAGHNIWGIYIWGLLLWVTRRAVQIAVKGLEQIQSYFFDSINSTCISPLCSYINIVWFESHPLCVHQVIYTCWEVLGHCIDIINKQRTRLSMWSSMSTRASTGSPSIIFIFYNSSFLQEQGVSKLTISGNTKLNYRYNTMLALIDLG